MLFWIIFAGLAQVLRSITTCPDLDCQFTCDEYRKVCLCPLGYQLSSDRKTCIQSCEIKNGGCHHLCFESERIGFPVCGCHEKYFLAPDNQTCIGTCALSNGHCGGFECLDTNQGPRCNCPQGFRRGRNVSTPCIDINECNRRNGGCEGKCRNFPGGYECVCPDGYTLSHNGKKCHDVNECLYPDSCQSSCINYPGSFDCQCPTGYYLYAKSRCADIDECGTSNGGCEYECINSPGSFHCSCPEEKILHPNGKNCLDLKTNCSWNVGAWISFGEKEEMTFHCTADKYTSIGPRKYSFRCEHGHACNGAPVSVRIPTTSCECIPSVPHQSNYLKVGCNQIPICDLSIKCEKENYGAHGVQIPVITIRAKLMSLGGVSNIIKEERVIAIQIQSLFLDALSKQNLHLEIGSTKYAFPVSGKNLQCDPGTYKNFRFNRCSPCPSGFYQPFNDKSFCYQCPIKDQFSRFRAASYNGCGGLCPPGTFSESGLRPCTSCVHGSYQPSPGMTNCLSCGRNIQTAFQGSTSFSDCLLPQNGCERAHYLSLRNMTCIQCPRNTYQSERGQIQCKLCPGELKTDNEGSVSISDCKETKCRIRRIKRSGIITSPNFPENYPSNVNCEWRIRTGNKKRGVLIIIPHLNLSDDQCKDHLVIRKSRSALSRKLYEACSPTRAPVILSIQAKKIWIQFKTDNQNTATGFYLRYVVFKEGIRLLIDDIATDPSLFALPEHRRILENRQFLDALVDVVAQPNNYQKYIHLHKTFPQSFLRLIWPKIHRFFDLPDLKS